MNRNELIERVAAGLRKEKEIPLFFLCLESQMMDGDYDPSGSLLLGLNVYNVQFLMHCFSDMLINHCYIFPVYNFKNDMSAYLCGYDEFTESLDCV